MQKRSCTCDPVSGVCAQLHISSHPYASFPWPWVAVRLLPNSSKVTLPALWQQGSPVTYKKQAMKLSIVLQRLRHSFRMAEHGREGKRSSSVFVGFKGLVVLGIKPRALCMLSICHCAPHSPSKFVFKPRSCFWSILVLNSYFSSYYLPRAGIKGTCHCAHHKRTFKDRKRHYCDCFYIYLSTVYIQLAT